MLCRLGRQRREIVGVDSTSGAFGHAFAAHLAEVEVDVRHIVFHLDSAEGAYFFAFATTDTSGRAGFASHSSFFLITASDIDAMVLGTFVAQLDDSAWASLDASAATHTFVLVDLGKTRFGIDSEGTERAGFGAATHTQAAEHATGLSAIEAVDIVAVLQTVEMSFSRCVGAGAVATDHSHHWSTLLGSAA